MKQYPPRLVPKPYFKLISTLPADSYFLRHTLQPLTDPSTGLINQKAIAQPREHVDGLSVNLLGIFQIEDGKVVVKKQEDIDWNTLWKEGEPGQTPGEDQWELSEDRGFVYLPLSSIQGIEISLGQGEDQFTVQLSMVHVPTICNFWHYEVHWMSVQTGDRYQPNTKGTRKRLGTAGRSVLAEYATIQTPDFYPLSPEKYSTEPL